MNDLAQQQEISVLEGHKNKEANFNLAQKQRQETGNECRDKLSEFYDKILIFSAGSFSFSITLVSLVSSKVEALTRIGFMIPNVYWMYQSAILFLISCGAVLLSKKMDALYVSLFGYSLWLESGIDLEQSKIKVYPALGNRLIITDLGNIETEIKTAEEKLSKMSPALIKATAETEFYYFWMRLLRGAAETAAYLGAVLLLFFAIQLIQAMVWR